MKKRKVFIFVLFVVILLSIGLYGNKGSIRYQREGANIDMFENNGKIITSDGSENCSLVGRALFGDARGVFVVGDTAYVAAGMAMVILDMTDKTDPVVVGYYYMDNSSFDVYATGDYAYVANGSSGLRIIDISDRTNPIEVGYYYADGFAYSVYVSGNYAYLADGGNGLRIIDVSDPTNPTEVGYYDTESSARDVFLAGDYAYVVDAYWDDSTNTYKGHLRIVDVSDPENPTEVGYCDVEDDAKDVYVVGTYAYVADDGEGLCTIDISDPTNPTEVSYYNTSGFAYSVYVVGDYAYVADDIKGLRIIDVSDPENPTEIGYYDTKDYSWGVYVSGDYAYVADNGDGIRIIDVSNPTNPTEVGCYHTGDHVRNVYVVGDYAYVADDVDGLRIIDVSDKSNPVDMGCYDGDSMVYNVYVSGNYAYLAEGYDGFRIVDVSDPENPIELGHYSTSNYARGVYVSGDYAYLVDGGDGLRILDVSDKTNPTEMGHYDTDGDARSVYVVGDYAYIADGYEGLRIIDVSDKSNPVETGYYVDSIVYSDDFAFDVHVVDDYAYIASGKGGLKIIDISDKTNPVEIVRKSMWYAVKIYVEGDYAYVADSDEGLKIINISDKTDPEEIGYYYADLRGVYVLDNYVYLADYNNGMYILDHISISLISPNGGGTYYISDVDTIKWYDRDSTDNIEISYTTDNGSTWQVIDTVSNTGSYVWTIPNTPSDSCRVKVKSTEYTGVEDISNEMFVIKKKIELTTFNNGIYYVSDTDTIKWESDTSIHQVEISYTIDDGSNWTVIDTVNDANMYVWDINTIASDSCRIKILSIDYPDVYDISDTVFSVVGINIISPDTNDNVEKDVYRDIVWESHLDSSYVSVLYSMDGGSSWEFIIDSTENDGNYSWYVNTDTLGSCEIRIILKKDSVVYDDRISGEFNIVDMIEITYPNGGEVLYPDSTYRIEWVCDTTVDYVNLYYSKDNGKTWDLITSGYIAGSHYYDWKTPDITGDSLLIKIENNSDTLIYDISDNVFAINPTWVGDLVNIFRITIPTLSVNGISIKYELSNAIPIKVKIYDTAGRLIKDETLQLGRGKDIYNIPINSKGIYFVKIYDNNGKLIGQSKVTVIK